LKNEKFNEVLQKPLGCARDFLTLQKFKTLFSRVSYPPAITFDLKTRILLIPGSVKREQPFGNQRRSAFEPCAITAFGKRFGEIESQLQSKSFEEKLCQGSLQESSLLFFLSV
jgi:hypothetical protein